MTGRELYEAWAPAFDEWSPWVKPVLFAEIDDLANDAGPVVTLDPSGLRCRIEARRDTAVVVDLPGPRSLAAGFDLAKVGYRPVPLYNTTSGRRQKVPPEKCVLPDVATLVRMLSAPLADHVRNTIVGETPPAFLLDSRRLKGGNKPSPGTYDNRWMVFPQDFPSAGFLKSRGIAQAVVVQEGAPPLADDLSHVLLRWKQAGIAISRQDADGDSSPCPVEIQQPSRFRSTMYRVLAMVGLRRNSAGGFGSIVPIPGQGGGFG
ncbi:MAG: hypothetical protein ABFD90_13015 [Phycisphaerales bacterium]